MRSFLPTAKRRENPPFCGGFYLRFYGGIGEGAIFEVAPLDKSRFFRDFLEIFEMGQSFSSDEKPSFFALKG